MTALLQALRRLPLPRSVAVPSPSVTAALPRASFERARPLELRLDGVVKEFAGRRVLDGLDLTVPAGQFVAVVGRSGGGKSTLMRLIVGLDRPSGGRVLVDGRPVSGLRPDVRLLFQDPRLLPWQRAVGNVGIARGPGWRERALAALDDVGLADRAEEWPSVLSGGQRQRVALARALVSNPGLLLLDEPFGALDALTRQEMHRLLRRIREEHGFGAVLITHDVAEAVALADRVLVLREGKIALDLDIGGPDQRPDESAVAALEARILRDV
ncbi:ATP-binding cassette domain-containing protein [Azospirillum doebereinerae]|uniref:ATP-binding cassette domain-containing protein n=1 Tax=Azospirillum doebereinerae TaxID=92933 RepID=A0A433J7M2_9PROT|nr:ATP-binding cassette domain-containing protein [Azospirillum doebereinerae]RUQ69692.1 ATP-binding cassette domain-containing protein [Azospirillum doebereinerae]